MLKIEYCNNGQPSTTTELLQVVFALIPLHWRAFLPLPLRVVISGDPLTCVAELADDIARTIRAHNRFDESLLTSPDPDLQEEGRDVAEMDEADDEPYDGFANAGVLAPQQFDPPAIFVHQGERTNEEIIRAFLNACGSVLAKSPQLKELMNVIAKNSPFVPPALALMCAFDDFCLGHVQGLGPPRSSSYLFNANLRKLDELLNPDPSQRRV